MSTEERLNIALNGIKASILKNEWKYYHIQSVENFIYHLKNLNGERTRDRMAAEIEAYMKLVAEKNKEELSLHDKSKELFPAIWKMSDTYKYEVGFIQKPSYITIGILIVGLIFVLLIFSTLLVSLATCTIILIIYLSYCYFKMKDRKFY